MSENGTPEEQKFSHEATKFVGTGGEVWSCLDCGEMGAFDRDVNGF